MVWKKITDLPDKQDFYLCGCATLDGRNPDCDYADCYRLALFDGKKFYELVNRYEDVLLLYWTEIPPLPEKIMKKEIRI